jgi:predicted GNAT family acetyltransferase
MAFELMMDEISKGNLDAKIVLNDEAATAINTAGRPATAQAADSGATQADATRQGAATPTTATERGDGGRGSRVEATQETEAKPKPDGEGVGKQDAKGKEAEEVSITTAKKMNASQNRYGITVKGEDAGFIITSNPINNIVKIKGVEVKEKLRGKGIAGDAYIKLGEELSNKGLTLVSDNFDTMEQSAVQVWEKLVDKKLAIKKENNYELKAVESPLSKEQTKQDTKGEKATQEGEVADKPKTPKEKLAEVRDRKKAAIDVLKTQWQNAKNTGISTNFEQRLKDDKAFFGAIRDIIQSNIEIGALKITDSLNDIADALGIKLSKADKDAIKGVFNKEVLRSLRNEQSDRFETETVREALSEYIEENKKVLKEAANAQALKLVNEASTEAGFNRAVKYIDKLINDTEFREAVNAATDATKPSNVRPALTKISVAKSIIDFFAGLKVTALEDVSLMQRLATILKAPGSVNIREITQLAEDVQKYLSEKQKDVLLTQSEVEKSVEGLLVRREKDADGNMQSVSKEFDTARKISNLAKKIAEVEANIYRLGLELDAQEAMLKSLDAAKRLVETKQSDLVEAIESFRASNIASAKQMITNIAKNVIDVSGRAKEALGLNAISQRLSELDSLSFYESERLINGLEQIANGYTPLGFFKAVAAPIINKPQVQAATLLQNQATALQKKIAKEFADNGGIIGSVRKIFDRIRFGKEAVAGGAKQADVRKITGNMAIAGLVNIDQMYKMAIKNPVLNGFWLPLRKAMNAYRADFTQTIRSFEKEAGVGIWTRVKGNAALLADSQIKSNIKVGAALAQASENAYRNKFNILQEQNNFFKNKAEQETGVTRIHIESVSQLAKQYPNGVTYKDLTPREKKVYDAFRSLVDNNLEAKQNMANISAGTPFEALQNYFPFIPSTNVKMFEKVGTQETDTAIKGLIAAKGDATKKAKIKSDRGLQRSMDADFYPIELDVFSAARISAAQTLKDYHLTPTLYTANIAINQVASETGGAVSAALSDIYTAEVITQLSSSRDPLARGASGVLNLLTAQKLGSLGRIPNEILSGFFGFTYVTGKYTRGSITFSPAVTEKLNEEFGASLLQSKGIKDMTDTVQKAKDLVEKLRSPDALNEGFWGNAAFAYSLRQKFKEATGKELEYSKLLDDDYIEANRKDIQAAYDAAIIGNALYDSSNVGQSLAVRFPGFGAILRKDKGELNRVANQYAMSFGRYAAKIGNNLSATISAKNLPDTEFSDPVTNKEVARKIFSTMAQGVVYQYAADAAIMGAKYGWTALKEGISDDDEEQKELEEARARLWDEYLLETFSAEKVALTAAGSLMYFGLGMYGSFGKAMIYLSAYGASKALDWMYENDKTITKAELSEAKKSLNNVLVSTTYTQTPRNEKEFEAGLLLVWSGGGKFVVSEVSNIGSSMADFFTDVASGDIDATNALYSMGTIYNATLGKRMQVPFPYLEDIGKASRSVAEVTETSSPEDISKAFKKDKQKAEKLINIYAQRTFIAEKEGNPNALKENEEMLRKSLKAAGFAEDDVKDKVELFEDRYNRSKMPLYLYKIINEKSPEASAGMAAEDFVSFAKDLEKATKKGDAEKIRIAEEQILVLRSTLRDKKMPRKGASGDDRRAFRAEFKKKLSESGIEY